MRNHPEDVAAALAGIGLTVASGAGEGLGLGLSATGAGAVAGVPVSAVSAAGMTAGVGITGAAMASIASNAAGGDRVEPVKTGEAGPTAQQAEREALNYANRPAKLDHVFVPKHKLDPLLEKFGGREGAMTEIVKSLRGPGVPESGPFEVVRIIGGQLVHVRGAVVNGVPKIGTAFTP